MGSFSKYITQAYIQSLSRLERSVYIRPPVKMNLPSKMVIKGVRRLYGIPELELNWHLSNTDNHMSKLEISRSRADPCLLYRHDGKGLIGMAILQVEDSSIVGC